MREPGDRPFHGSVATFLLELAGEDRARDKLLALDLARQMVLEPVRKPETRLARYFAVSGKPGRGASPPDFDSAEQISLRARHLEQATRIEIRLLPEDLRVGMEAHAGAAAVGRGTDRFELRRRNASRETLAVQHLAARDFHLQHVRQGVDDAHADAVQSARGLIDLGVEFAARMQHRHDHFECGFLRKFRVGIDRNAAPVVGHTDRAIVLKLDLDEARMARDRLVHRIVDDLGEEMMHRLLIRAPDIHAGATADGLEPLEDFDRGSGVAELARRPVLM